MGQSIQEWTKWNLWKTAFKQTISLQIFERLSSTNFASSILEYIVSNYVFLFTHKIYWKYTSNDYNLYFLASKCFAFRVITRALTLLLLGFLNLFRLGDKTAPAFPPPHLYINMCSRKARVMKFCSYIHHHVCFQNIHKDYC